MRIDPVRPANVLPAGGFTPAEIAIARVNSRLGEPWAGTEVRSGREVTYRQIGITSADAAGRVADRFRSAGWAVEVDADREVLTFRTAAP